MSATRRYVPLLMAAAATALLAGCGRGKADSMLVRESFNSDDTYSRSVPVAPAAACEAARRALLSQGYGIARADAAAVEGSKNFQPSEEAHEQLNLRVSCVAQGEDKAWIFVSAVQDRYALKKSPTSASVGVGVLGSVSLPVGSSNDSMVRVASSTVQDGAFYRNFFQRLDQYLPKNVPKPGSGEEARRPPAQAPAAPAIEPPPALPPPTGGAGVSSAPQATEVPAAPEMPAVAPETVPEAAQPAPSTPRQEPASPQ